MKILQWLTHLLPTLVPDKKYRVELVEHHEKRSLDANSYAWVLMGKIADKLTAEAQGDVAYSKDDVYLDMLKHYGQGGVVKVPNKDVEKFRRTWKYHGPHEKLWEEKATYFKFWVGSSNYTTQEMSVFIDGIVSECKQMGIETETPQRLAAMMEAWDEAE